MTHKKRVSAMCLSKCGFYLISGDLSGMIYIWSSTANLNSDNNEAGSSSSGLISTYELHKDGGAITNLIPLFRPLTLFGLTANLKAYETPQIKPLQKFVNPSV